jgi:hypothetical protein
LLFSAIISPLQSIQFYIDLTAKISPGVNEQRLPPPSSTDIPLRNPRRNFYHHYFSPFIFFFFFLSVLVLRTHCWFYFCYLYFVCAILKKCKRVVLLHHKKVKEFCIELFSYYRNWCILLSLSLSLSTHLNLY